MGGEFSMDEKIATFVKHRKSLITLRDKINQEFEAEWENKKFKWVFPKYRRNKLYDKIFHKYNHPICELIREVINLLPLIDIKNIIEGEKE